MTRGGSAVAARRPPPAMARVDGAEEGFLRVGRGAVEGVGDGHVALFLDEPREGVFLPPHRAEIALLFDRAAVIHKVDAHVAVVVRAAVDLHAADEGCIGLVHDHVSWPYLFEHVFVQIAVIRMYHHQIVHLVKLEIILHVLERVDCDFFLLAVFGGFRLDVCHQ